MAGRIAYYGNIVKNGLILDLDAAKLDSYPRTGTAWNDISGFGNNGTLTNGPTFNSDNYGSIVFDGVNDFGSIPQNNILNLSGNGGTVEATYSIVSIPPNNTAIVSKRGGADSSIPYHLGTPAGTTKVRCIVNNLGSLNIFDSISSLGLGNIKTVSMTFSSTYRGLYINGVLDNFQSTTITLSNNNSGIIIAANGDSAFWFNNIRLYSVKIYNRALSSSEVLQNYNATKGRYL